MPVSRHRRGSGIARGDSGGGRRQVHQLSGVWSERAEFVGRDRISWTQLDLGGNVGLRSDGTVANLHGHPSGGGRLGFFLPLPYKPHYDLELGVSGQSGEWDDAGNHLWSAGVLDAALHLGPNFEAKGEYILTRYGSDDIGFVTTRRLVCASRLQAGRIGSGAARHQQPGTGGSLRLLHASATEQNCGHQNPAIHRGLHSTISRTRCCLKATMSFSTATTRSQADQFILQLSLGF